MEWIKMTIENGVTGTKVEAQVKIYDEPSELHGIEGGRISKLYMTQDGACVFNYDRGLDVPAQTPDAITALGLILKAYN